MNLRRVLKIFGIVAVVGVLGYAAFIGLFFYLMGLYEDVEIARFPNPSGSMEAVVVERYGNATVSTKTLIYIVPARAKVPKNPQFMADYVDDLTVDWKNDKNLEIRAKNARIYGVDYYFYPPPPAEFGTITYKIVTMGRPE